MERTRRSTDVLAGIAVAVATLGMWLAFYRLVGNYREGSLAVGVSGWHFVVGVSGWALCALSAVVLWSRHWPRSPATARLLTIGALCVAGGGSAVAVVALVDVPDGGRIAAAALEHVDRDELRAIAVESIGWMPTGSSVEVGLGPISLLLGAILLLVAAAGDLRRRRVGPASRWARRDGSE